MIVGFHLFMSSVIFKEKKRDEWKWEWECEYVSLTCWNWVVTFVSMNRDKIVQWMEINRMVYSTTSKRGKKRIESMKERENDQTCS